ncbi:hypothetical protein [Treponema sp.]|uniref:hypothetical protein n=1 Tax=Treponema sp. TaxID=166 RepID=UPI003FA31461
MKKIAVLLLLVLALAGCQMYKTKDTIIENKSDYVATVDAKNFKENDKQILSYKFTVSAGKSLLLPMYTNGDVSIVSIGRNYLKKVTDTHYEILNAQPVSFIVYNTINKKVRLSDMHNLFDTQTINEEQTIHMQIFNPEKIQPIAVSGGVVLKADVQNQKIIIKY